MLTDKLSGMLGRVDVCSLGLVGVEAHHENDREVNDKVDGKYEQETL